MKQRVFERVLSGQTAAIRLSGSVYYHSLCNALGIDVPSLEKLRVEAIGLRSAMFAIGTPAHVGGELFNVMTGIGMIHVPYSGSAPILADLLGR
jgi:hypothetical protein